MAQKFLTGIEAYAGVDLKKTELKNAVIQNLAAEPSSPVKGQIYFNTADNKLYVYDGTAWEPIEGDIQSVTAGDGLSGGGDSGAVTLNVNVDDSTIEINSDSLRVKAGGIGSNELAATGVTADTYGSAIAIPVITVDEDGRLTSVSTASVSSDLSISGDTGTDTVSLLSDTLDFNGTANQIVTTVTDNQVTFSLPADVTIAESITVGSPLSSDAPVITSTSSSNAENILLVSTNTDTSTAPDLVLYKDKFPYTDGDTLGKVEFRGNNVLNSAAFAYNQIISRIIDASQQQSSLTLAAFYGSTTAHALAVHNLGDSVGQGAVIVNAPTGLTVPTATLDVRGNAIISTDLVVGGNFTVNGTVTTVNTETINLADNIIKLNSNALGAAIVDAGIEVERGDDPNVQLIWNETSDKWQIEVDPVNDTYQNIATENYVAAQIEGISGSATIGDGVSTSIVVNHGFNTMTVMVQLYDTSTGETVYADVVRTDNNNITINFAQAPAFLSYRVLIVKVQ